MNRSPSQVRLNRPAVGSGTRVALWLLLVLAATEFTIRGPARYVRNPSEWNDFSQNYTASKLWLRGKSPANPKNFVVLWKEQTWIGLSTADIRTHLAPPLGGLVVLAPVAFFPWKTAKIIWLLLLLTSFAATVWVFVRILGGSRNEVRTLIFVAACLALAPFHTGIANGNTSILVIALCTLAIGAALEEHDTAAGLALRFCVQHKAQLGAFLVLYYLVRRRWRLFTVAVGCTASLNLIAALYLHVRGAAWLQDYLNNAKGFVTTNNIDSFTSENPGRSSLINLQVPFLSDTKHVFSQRLGIGGHGSACLWLALIRPEEKGRHGTAFIVDNRNHRPASGLPSLLRRWAPGHPTLLVYCGSHRIIDSNREVGISLDGTVLVARFRIPRETGIAQQGSSYPRQISPVGVDHYAARDLGSPFALFRSALGDERWIEIRWRRAKTSIEPLNLRFMILTACGLLTNRTNPGVFLHVRSRKIFVIV